MGPRLCLAWFVVLKTVAATVYTPAESNTIEVAFPVVPLATCRRHTVCAFLQTNAGGVNVQQLCSCPDSPCPTIWDPEDGYSITQESDQYKFCDPVPSYSRRPCSEKEVAYRSHTFYDLATGEKVRTEDFVPCTCPHGHVLTPGDASSGTRDQYEVFISTSLCSPMLECEESAPCKVVSKTATDFLVSKKCRCGQGSSCPTLGRPTSSFSLGKGSVSLIPCQ